MYGQAKCIQGNWSTVVTKTGVPVGRIFLMLWWQWLYHGSCFFSLCLKRKWSSGLSKWIYPVGTPIKALQGVPTPHSIHKEELKKKAVADTASFQWIEHKKGNKTHLYWTGTNLDLWAMLHFIFLGYRVGNHNSFKRCIIDPRNCRSRENAVC